MKENRSNLVLLLAVAFVLSLALSLAMMHKAHRNTTHNVHIQKQS